MTDFGAIAVLAGASFGFGAYLLARVLADVLRQWTSHMPPTVARCRYCDWAERVATAEDARVLSASHETYLHQGSVCRAPTTAAGAAKGGSNA